MGKKRVAFRTWNPPTNNGREIVEDYYHKIDRQDMYDPGLVSDVEKENRYPDDAESSTDNKISGCNDEKKSTVDNPLESPRLEDNVDVKDLAEIWNTCGDSLELKNAMNSLEQRGLIGDEASREKKPNQSSNVVDVDSGKLRPGDTSNCRQLTNCGNISQNLDWPTNRNNDSEKIVLSCACRKREEYQENTQRRKSRKQGVDSESQQVWGKGRPQTRYNLRPRND